MSSETVVYDGYGDIPIKSYDEVVLVNSIPRKVAVMPSKASVPCKVNAAPKHDDKSENLGLPEEEEVRQPLIKQGSRERLQEPGARDKLVRSHPSWCNPYIQGSVGTDHAVSRVLRQSESFLREGNTVVEPVRRPLMKTSSQPHMTNRGRRMPLFPEKPAAEHTHKLVSSRARQLSELVQQVPSNYQLRQVLADALPRDPALHGPQKVLAVTVGGVFVDGENQGRLLQQSYSAGKLAVKKSRSKDRKLTKSVSVKVLELPPVQPPMPSKKKENNSHVQVTAQKEHDVVEPAKSLHVDIPDTSNAATMPKMATPRSPQTLHSKKTAQHNLLQQQRSGLALLKMSDSQSQLHVGSNLLLSVSAVYEDGTPLSPRVSSNLRTQPQHSTLLHHIPSKTCGDAFFLYQYMQLLSGIVEPPRLVSIRHANASTIPCEPACLLTNMQILTSLNTIHADSTAKEMLVSRSRLEESVLFSSFAAVYHEYCETVMLNEHFAGMQLCSLAMIHKRQTSLLNTMKSPVLSPRKSGGRSSSNNKLLFEDIMEDFNEEDDVVSGEYSGMTVRRVMDADDSEQYAHVRKQRDKELVERQRLVTELKGEVIQSPTQQRSGSFWANGQDSTGGSANISNSSLAMMSTSQTILEDDEEENAVPAVVPQDTQIHAEHQDVHKKAQFSVQDAPFPLPWMPHKQQEEFLQGVLEQKEQGVRRSVLDAIYAEDGSVKTNSQYSSLETIWKLLSGDKQSETKVIDDNNNNSATEDAAVPVKSMKHRRPAAKSVNSTPVKVVEVKTGRFTSPLPSDGISVAPIWKRVRPVDRNVEFTLLHSKEGGGKVLESVRLPPQARLAFSVSQEEALLQYYQLQLQYSLKNRPNGESVMATPLVVATKPNQNSLIGAPEELTKLVLNREGEMEAWEEALHSKRQELAEQQSRRTDSLQLHELAHKRRLQREIDELQNKYKRGGQKTGGLLFSNDNQLVEDERVVQRGDEENTIHELAVKSQSAQVQWVIYHLRQVIVQLAPEDYAPPSILGAAGADPQEALLQALRRARVQSLCAEEEVSVLRGTDGIPVEQDPVDLQLQMDLKQRIEALLAQYGGEDRSDANVNAFGKFLVLNEEVDADLIGQVKTSLRMQSSGFTIDMLRQQQNNQFSVLKLNRQADDTTEQLVLDLKKDKDDIEWEDAADVVEIEENTMQTYVGESEPTEALITTDVITNTEEVVSRPISPVSSSAVNISSPNTPLKSLLPAALVISDESTRPVLLSPFEFGGSVHSAELSGGNSNGGGSRFRRGARQALFVDVSTPVGTIGTVRRLDDESRASSRASSRSSSRGSTANRSRSGSRVRSSRPSSPRAILASTRNLKSLFSSPGGIPSNTQMGRRGSFSQLMTPTPLQQQFITPSAPTPVQSSKTTPLVLYSSSNNYKQGHLNLQRLQQLRKLNPDASIVGLVEQCTSVDGVSGEDTTNSGAEDISLEPTVSILDLAKQAVTLKPSKSLDLTGVCVLALASALEALLGLSEQRDLSFRERILKVSLDSVKQAMDKAQLCTSVQSLQQHIPTLARILYVLQSLVSVTQASVKHMMAMRASKREEQIHAGLQWYRERKQVLRDVQLLLQEQSQTMTSMLEHGLADELLVGEDEEEHFKRPEWSPVSDNPMNIDEKGLIPLEQPNRDLPIPTKSSASGLLMLPDIDAMITRNMQQPEQ